MFSRKFCWTAALLATVMFSMRAQAYPDRPLTLIVPFAAGGSADLIARLVAGPIGKELGQTLILENRAGAGGPIGAAAAARALPNGYTLFFSASGPNAVAPSIYQNLTYDPVKSFVPVSMVTTQPSVVAVNPSLGVDNLAQLIALAKASPGALNFGSPGTGTTAHLGGEMFKSLTGTQITHVPYKSGQIALQDLIQNRIQIEFDNVGQFLPFVKAGTIKILATIGDNRMAALPDVPTTAEAGLPGFQYSIWFGINVPAGTPKDIVTILNKKIVAAMNRPETSQALAQLNAEVRTMSPEEFQKFIVSDIEKWAKVIKTADLKPQ